MPDQTGKQQINCTFFMKLTQLTFTRFLAAIAIVIFHFHQEVFPFSLKGIKELTGFLNVLVSYFFVLSGFILTINTGEKLNLKQFYFNRFSRIYPVYIFALLFTLLLILDIRPLSFSWDFHRVLLSVFLVQSWNPNYALALNYPAWSLSAEAFFYLLFPFVYLGLQRLSFRRKVMLVVFFWLLMQVLFASLAYARQPFVLYNPVFHLSTFLMGILGGLFYREKKAWLMAHYRKAVHLLIVTTLVLLFLMLTENKLFRMVYHNGILSPVFMLSIFIVAESRSRLIRWFGLRKPEYLGEISYGIYILQVPVYRLLTQATNLKSVMPASGFFFSYVVVLLVVSIISYELIERPSRLFLRRKFFP